MTLDRQTWPWIGALVGASALIAAAPAKAVTGFQGYYAPGNWTFVSTNGGDGSVDTSGAPSSIVITGSDNDVGSSDTDYTITTNAPGTVSFSYNYTTIDEPFYDGFGYLLNGAYNTIADDAASGTTSFAVSTGDVFGFRVYSTDSDFGPGVVTISNFSAPESAPEVPGPLPILGTAAVFATSRRLRKRMAASSGSSRL